MRTLGIDLASQAASTVACAIDWTHGAASVSFLEAGVDDGRALALIWRQTPSASTPPSAGPSPSWS